MTSRTFSTEYVTSRDGTRIGYRRQGHGPGIVLVQGAMADATAYSTLAAELADPFTVMSADRRGRGLSPKPYSRDHDISRDVDDIDAILKASGATTVFGLSSGAVIALEAARTLPLVERAVVFEPPFYRNGIDRAGITRLSAELDRGDLPSALLDALLVAGTAPAVIRRTPRPLARVLTRAIIAVDARTRRSGDNFRELLPGVRYDFHDVAEVDGDMGRYRTVEKPVLLISGTTSPRFLQIAIRDLDQLLPNAAHVELHGLGHDGPWNDGQPAAVATAIRDFLTAEHHPRSPGPSKPSKRNATQADFSG